MDATESRYHAADHDSIIRKVMRGHVGKQNCVWGRGYLVCKDIDYKVVNTFAELPKIVSLKGVLHNS